MDNINETFLIIWLGALIAPPMLYGIVMQLWMANDEGGKEFLLDRQVAAGKARHRYSNRDDDDAKSRAKTARLEVGHEAANGKYGTEVQQMIAEAWVLLKYYLVYAAVMLAVGGFMFA